MSKAIGAAQTSKYLSQVTVQLASLRRLYQHVENHGAWNYQIDNKRLSLAISTIEKQHATIQMLENDERKAG